MSKNSLLLLFGGMVVAVSFLGIPSSWKTIIFSALGVLIIIIALLLRKDIATGALCMHLTREKQTNSYKQNGMLRDNSHNDKERSKKESKKENREDDSPQGIVPGGDSPQGIVPRGPNVKQETAKVDDKGEAKEEAKEDGESEHEHKRQTTETQT